MGIALQVVNGQATNPGATVTALTPNTGDSFTVRNAQAGSNVRLADAWCYTNTNLLMRYRSPLLHDVAQNARLQPVAAKSYPLMNSWAVQSLEPQDPLIVEITGGAAEVDAGALLIYYDNLPGAAARLFDMSEITGNVANLFTVEVDVVSSGTACNYSPTVALNGSFDTFRRNIDYAILGYTCATEGVSLGITGADTSNLRVGGPLTAAPWITRDWFVWLNRKLGVPCIPVVNSANVAATNVDVVAQATSTTYKVGIHLAQLTNALAGHGS
jgi:hypothetical protein